MQRTVTIVCQPRLQFTDDDDDGSGCDDVWRLINQNSQAKTAISQEMRDILSQVVTPERRTVVVRRRSWTIPLSVFPAITFWELVCTQSMMAQDHFKFCHRSGVSRTFICSILIFKNFKYKREIVAHIDRHRVSFIVLVKGGYCKFDIHSTIRNQLCFIKQNRVI